MQRRDEQIGIDASPCSLQGATLNGDPIHTTEHPTLQGSTIVCSRTEMKKGWFSEHRIQRGEKLHFSPLLQRRADALARSEGKRQ